jgi:hypothetical protein
MARSTRLRPGITLGRFQPQVELAADREQLGRGVGADAIAGRDRVIATGSQHIAAIRLDRDNLGAVEDDAELHARRTLAPDVEAGVVLQRLASRLVAGAADLVHRSATSWSLLCSFVGVGSSDQELGDDRLTLLHGQVVKLDVSRCG